MYTTEIQLAGEFRFVVKDSSNNIKLDTDYHRNLILDSGLDLFANSYSDDKKHSVLTLNGCAIGSGSSPTERHQTGLDSLVWVTGTTSYMQYLPYDIETNGNLYKYYREFKAEFRLNKEQSITEVAIGNLDYRGGIQCFCRSLIKGASGEPITIVLKEEDVLIVYYRLWQVFEIKEKTGQVNLTYNNEIIPYNFTIRLADLGELRYEYIQPFLDPLVRVSYGKYTIYTSITLYDTELEDSGHIYENSDYGIIPIPYESTSITAGEYVQGSFTIDIFYTIHLTEKDITFRTLVVRTPLGSYQIRFGRVDDDSKLIKPKRQRLTFQFNFTWGRYEGEL